MKLADLHEARYAGNHPLVDRILKLYNERVVRYSDTFSVKDRDIPIIVKSLEHHFGPPDLTGNGEYHWMKYYTNDNQRFEIVIYPTEYDHHEVLINVEY